MLNFIHFVINQRYFYALANIGYSSRVAARIVAVDRRNGIERRELQRTVGSN